MCERTDRKPRSTALSTPTGGHAALRSSRERALARSSFAADAPLVAADGDGEVSDDADREVSDGNRRRRRWRRRWRRLPPLANAETTRRLRYAALQQARVQAGA